MGNTVHNVATDRPRRFANYIVAPETLLYLGTGTYEVVKNAVDPGARMVACAWDTQRAVFVVTLEHDDWPEIQVGKPIPELADTVIRRCQVDSG